MATEEQNGIGTCSALLPELATLLHEMVEQLEQEPNSDATTSMDMAIEGLRGIERRLRGSIAADTQGQCVLRGISPAIPIQSVLTFLSANHRTGTLRVSTDDENITLQIAVGDVVHGYSDHPPCGERLGDILVERGAIESHRLERFLDDRPASSVNIGEALEQAGLVDAAVIREALEQQTQQLMHRICTADEVTFEFHHAAAPVPGLHIRTKVIQLLLESTRAQQEEEASQADTDGGSATP